MSTVCADQQHKLLLSPKSKPYCAFKDIEIPPRKLLLNTKNHPHRRHHHHHPHHHHQADYASAMLFSDETADSLPYKFLPFNNADGDSDSESDPYASDHFRMYEFKIRRCTRSRSHDWTDCPFAHPGEKARRRDPRRYHYSGTVCSEYRRGGGCSRGDDCEFAHGVFECWLHPSRYRTEACKDGKNCKRKVCFFAHSPRQLRILPELPVSSSPKHSNNNSANILHSLSPHRDSPANQNKNHCCMYCCHTMNSSPTSTLLSNLSHLSRSPSMSPPISPVKHGFSPMSSRHGGGCSGSCGGGGGFTDCLNKFGAGNADMASSMSYKEMLNELMSSLDAMSFGNELSSPGGSSGGGGGGVMNNVNVNVPWFDPNSFNGVEDQTQFVLSPSTPNYPANSAADQSAINPFGGKVHRSYSNNKSKFINDDQKFVNDNNNNNNGGSSLPNGTDPDLGWVNDLLT